MNKKRNMDFFNTVEILDFAGRAEKENPANTVPQSKRGILAEKIVEKSSFFSVFSAMKTGHLPPPLGYPRPYRKWGTGSVTDSEFSAQEKEGNNKKFCSK